VVIRNPQQRFIDAQRGLRPPLTNDPRALSNPTGKTPYNAGGSWPNRAQEYARGMK
jgi:hypothetical protein